MSTLRFGTLLANRGKELIAGAHSYMSPVVSSALKQSVIDGALIGAAGGALWGGLTSRDGFLEGAGRGAVRGAMTGALSGAAWGLYNSPIGSNFKDQIRARSNEIREERNRIREMHKKHEIEVAQSVAEARARADEARESIEKANNARFNQTRTY
jgi:hypothetical protein